MPLLLIRRFMCRVERHGWMFPLAVIICSYSFGQIMMILFEPPGAAIRNPLNYTWFYFVSSTSTGYGDLYPVTVGGRIGGVIVIIAGLSAGVLFLGYLGSIFSRRGRRRMLGQAKLYHQDHIVVVGYHRDFILDLIAELRGDSRYAKTKVVVCFLKGQLTGENPDPKVYDVIEWDSQALTRAGAIYAQTIYVATGDDDRSIRHMIRVNGLLREHSADQVHVLMGIINPQHQTQMATDLERLNSDFELIQAQSPASVANAIQNPGMATFNEGVATNFGDSASQYRVHIPEDIEGYWYWKSLATYLIDHEITLQAVADSHKPKARFRSVPDKQAIRGGHSLVLVAEQRPTLDWSAIPAAA